MSNMSTFLSQIAKINDHLYLSSFAGATEYNCNKFNINCVITVCKEVPKLDIKNVEVVRLEVLDKPTESLNKHFDFVADKINEVGSRKGACLVHCVAGISRSASMVLVYLMKYQKMSLKDAHTHTKSKRPFVSRYFFFFINHKINSRRKLVISFVLTFGISNIRPKMRWDQVFVYKLFCHSSDYEMFILILNSYL
jgi:hypothetical protein